MSGSAAPSEDGPPTKKPRSSSSGPDLKILVGQDKKVFYHHSVILATHSDYVDAMLASPMVENENREISFPDIEPALWNTMLALLEDPSMIRRVSLKDVMQVILVYDKYQFSKGKQLCVDVFMDYFEQSVTTAKLDLDTLVEAVVLADQANLEDCKRKGVAALAERLESPEHRIKFTQSQITKLIPLIGQEERLLDAINVTADDILIPAFPRFLVQSFQLWQTRQWLNEAVSTIRISCARFNSGRGFACQQNSNDPDRYDAKNLVKWSRTSTIDSTVNFSIRRSKSMEWVISGIKMNSEDRRALCFWKCPQSSNMDLPPRRGWEAVDESVQGVVPTLQYVYN